jgi:hypothetical protein
MRNVFWTMVAAVALIWCGAGRAAGDQVVYATASSIGPVSVFGKLDLTTGRFTQIASLSTFIGSLTAGPGGTLYGGGTDGHLYTIRPSGATTQFGSLTESAPLWGLAAKGNAGFYADFNMGGQYTFIHIAPDGNGATTVGSTRSPFFSSGNLAFGPNGTLYFEAYKPPSPAVLYSLNISDGVLTPIGSSVGVPNGDSLTLGTVGGTLYGVDAGATSSPGIYTIDTATDATTQVGTVSGLPAGYTLDTFATPTPEPSTIATATLGALALAGYGWRRRAPAS